MPPVAAFLIKECKWIPPPPETIMICYDGASRGNPGNGGASVIFRDSECACLGALSAGLGFSTNFSTEILAIIIVLHQAAERGWRKVWIVSDSAAAIKAFNHDNIPWFMKAKWQNGTKEVYVGRHPMLPGLELPDTSYFRFS
ncbi:Ribonuclease H domain [Macleaya cordata]|uniref:Ribonuclease H domain n=1 Tax=Macleaya cordata TaxID=56857 RepID=A0A200QJB5_MACCD|nr:Ribonuclease H domain [Macleaya cordata]